MPLLSLCFFLYYVETAAALYLKRLHLGCFFMQESRTRLENDVAEELDIEKDSFYTVSNYLHALKELHMEEHVDTRDRILQATITLIKERGFKGATTRAIAQEAGVNEVTIFRHFHNKTGLVQAAFEKVTYVPSLSKAIREKVEWDLQKDLLMFSMMYQQVLNENRDLIMIGLKEGNAFPELEQLIADIPRQLKEVLVHYFQTMREKGKLIETNVEAQAMALIWINFGYFRSQSEHGTYITPLKNDEFLQNAIEVFARGLAL